MSGTSLIGHKLGDYKIVEMLGQGGMARVYKGYDPNLDRYAAVKVIDPTGTPTEEEVEYRERFTREARAIASLNHSNIVGVYQFGKTEATATEVGLYYMAMEFIEGRDLREILKEYRRKGKRMEHSRILRIMRDTASALDYAHEKGVIHRDIKPSNIMISRDGRAVLTDFGLALRAQEGTLGNTFGSVHYIAPEQAVSSAQARPQSDLYSLGIVLYETLTGRVPFDDNSAMSVALQHISDPPPPPTQLNPAISPEIEKVVMKILEKEPERRYPTGMAFVTAIERAFTVSDDEDTHELRSAMAMWAMQTTTDDNELSVIEQVKSNTDITGAFKETTEHHRQALIQAEAKRAEDARRQSDPQVMAPEDALIESDYTPSGRGTLPRSTLANAPVEEKRTSPWALIGVLIIILLAVVGAGLVALTGGNNSTAVSDQATDTATHTSEPEATATITASDDDDNGAVVVGGGEDATVSATPEATATHTAEARATDTAEPTATHTQEVTASDTAEPTATETSTPTDTPEPTVTLTPSHTPTPTMTKTPDLEMISPDDPQVLLRYDGRSIVLYNRSDENVNLFEIIFVGETSSFDASDWGINSIRDVPPDVCYQAWTVRYVQLAENEYPADICASRRGFIQTPRTFWISETPGATFEVRLGNSVLATCDAVSANNRTENRCVVDVRRP